MNWQNLRLPVLVLLAALLALGVAIKRNYSQSPAVGDIDGGLPIHRERIDRVISHTSSLDIEQAVASLASYNESYELAQLASLSPSSLQVHFFRQVLADRRACKIFEYLLSLPREDAARKAEKIFDQQFGKVLSNWQSMSVTRGIEVDNPAHHAALVGLFLCSYFCPPDVLDDKIDLWSTSMSEESFDRIDGVELAAGHRYIDRLFHLNLLVISGQRAGASTDKLNTELREFSKKLTGDPEPFLQVSDLKVFKWNAETTDTDFTHITRGVPASGNSVLLELPGFADPNSIFKLNDQQVYDHLVQTISNWRRSATK